MVALGIFLPERSDRGLEYFALRRANVQLDDVDDARGDVFGQFIAQQRNDHLIAGNDDLVDAFFSGNARDDIDHFLGVLGAEVVDVALITGLRPATDLMAFRLDALDVINLFDSVAGEYENPRRVGIRKDGDVARELVDESGQRIKVQLIGDVDVMAIEWRNQ